jgi:hypothetical protein
VKKFTSQKLAVARILAAVQSLAPNGWAKVTHDVQAGRDTALDPALAFLRSATGN